MRLLPVRSVILTLALLTWIEAECFGQAFIESLFPPAVQRGAVTRITLNGSRMGQATALWTTLSNNAVHAVRVGESDDESAVYDVKVADDAPVGFYGLRLATTDGLSNAHIFLIDELPATIEAEVASKAGNNGSVKKAQPVELPAVVAGTCRDADVDFFTIEVAADQRVTFEVVGSRLGKGLDPLLTIRDMRGREVTSADSHAGLFFDLRFAHTFAEAGRYAIEVRDARFHGSEHWAYLLRMGKFAEVRAAIPSTVQVGSEVSLTYPQLGPEPLLPMIVSQSPPHFFHVLRRAQDEMPAWMPMSLSEFPNTIESEPNDSHDRANETAVPANLHGVINQPSDRDYFGIELKQGQRVRFRTETRVIGSPADLQLSLNDPGGELAGQADDSGFDDALFDFTAKKEGRHVLTVSDVIGRGGTDFVYRIEVTAPQPQIKLVSEARRPAIPRATWQPLPMKLTRTDFAGPVDLSLIGGPPGATLKLNRIEAGVSEIVNALHVPHDAPLGVYTLQIVGRAESDGRTFEAVARTHPLIDRKPTGVGPHGEPFELREDQLRLPYTLTDRMAVLVTPQSPFDFELPTEPVTVPRYQSAELPIQTSRDAEFDGPISFVAMGGTLQRERLQKPTLTASIPNATQESTTVNATLTSGVNTPLTQHRVTLTGTAVHKGRTISLTRMFELRTQVAFRPAADQKQITVQPGTARSFKLSANRLAPFAGSVTVNFDAPEQLGLPTSVTIPAGEETVEVKIEPTSATKPGKHEVKLAATARVAKYRESGKGEAFEVVVASSAK